VHSNSVEDAFVLQSRTFLKTAVASADVLASELLPQYVFEWERRKDGKESKVESRASESGVCG
jgi:hypothetical protein